GLETAVGVRVHDPDRGLRRRRRPAICASTTDINPRMTRTASVRSAALLGTLATTVLLALATAASANVPLTPVSPDPLTKPPSQHATEVEPDTFAFGATVLAAFQVGRFVNGGASDVGYARSNDGGATWVTSSFLPGLTFNAGSFSDPGNPFEAVSDATV